MLQLETLALIGLALGAGSLVKGATGMGLPLIATPILAASLGVPRAIAIMTVPILVTNAWQIWRYRFHASGMGFLKNLLVTGALGVGIGTWLLTAIPERHLSLALGLLMVGYIGLTLGRADFRASERVSRAIAPIVGLAAGTLQGATGISSPIAATFIHAMRLRREAHVFAVSSLFLLLSVTQVPALMVAGIMSTSRLLEGIIALVPVAAMLPVGNWLGGRLSRRTFDRVILGLLAVIAADLIWSSFQA
ncbi:MAG TPA: sulfite exporter TauE/SafE family protein [Arenibaculum sp.]|nr:sulfite exporter TauE/SafE family protein [Arenibaculum sp.]